MFSLNTHNMKWTFTYVHCDFLFSSITYHQLLFAIFSCWKSIMFHSDKVNTLLLPRPAAQIHFPKRCLKTCRPTNSMSKLQRYILQRSILVLNMVKIFQYLKKMFIYIIHICWNTFLIVFPDIHIYKSNHFLLKHKCSLSLTLYLYMYKFLICTNSLKQLEGVLTYFFTIRNIA